MKQRVKDLCEVGDRLFSSRMPVMSLWQEIAEHFYPERADFTVRRELGDEFAAGLMTGLPSMIRRELADQIAAMIRPKGKQWFTLSPVIEDKDREKREVSDWIRTRMKIMYRAMYDTHARLARAVKETDNDYVTFGQGVLTSELDEETNTLLYRNWHIRDVAWTENDRLEIDNIHREWKIQARDMLRRWPSTVSSKVRECVKKEPFKEICCRHVVLPYDEYDYTPSDGRKRRNERWRYMSILVDRENETILYETPLVDHPYVIPRWQTVSGSQYAHSPATVIALPDARLLQRITFTLLQAGEKAVDPPMLAVQEAIRSDVDLQAGGITWVDSEYDTRLNDILRPLNMDKTGLAFGADMAERYENIIRAAFYLNKIMLPAFDGRAMTATEVRTRTEEYIRAALPLFEPIESDYNGQLCEKTFQILLRNGAFGSVADIPRELQGEELKWSFESPLTEAMNREDAISFQEAAGLLATAASIDPSLSADYDIRTHFRRAMAGVGAPMVDREEADEAMRAAQEMQAMRQMAEMVGQGGAAAEQVGKAAQALSPIEGV